MPAEIIETALDLELKDGEVIADSVDGERCIFLAGPHRAERAIAARIKALSSGALFWPAIDAAKAIRWVEARPASISPAVTLPEELNSQICKVPHHQGAIDMALAELHYGRNEQLRRLAQEIIVTQRQEIAAMRLAVGEPLPPSTPAPTQPFPSSAPDQPSGTARKTQPVSHHHAMHMLQEP